MWGRKYGEETSGLSADLGMTAGEENAAAPQVTQDAGSIWVLTPLPSTRLREGECVVTAEFSACSSSLLPRLVLTLGPARLQSGLQCFVRILSEVTFLEGLGSGNWVHACSTPSFQFQAACAWRAPFKLLHKHLLSLGCKRCSTGDLQWHLPSPT